MFVLALVVGACYLLGSVPFPVIISRLVLGIDLREHGSGNMGATNAARVLGKRWFPLVFGLDLAKGALATYLARVLLPMALPVDPALAAAAGGLAAVIGHCFPIFAGFRGGVGLAASAGALLVVSPWLLLSAGAGILLFWAITRNMYVGVACTALLYPLMGWYWLRAGDTTLVLAAWGLVVFGVHWKDVSKWLAGYRRA
ncbi:MAG TPA: glycerol-3-phosphate acyltransferase [Symbiobacteriaceae bacterium]|jgi:glycerol-3-phosphate acyltransferase PlsY